MIEEKIQKIIKVIGKLKTEVEAIALEEFRAQKQKWVFSTEGILTSSPTVSNGVVYFGSGNGCLYAVNI